MRGIKECVNWMIDNENRKLRNMINETVWLEKGRFNFKNKNGKTIGLYNYNVFESLDWGPEPEAINFLNAYTDCFSNGNEYINDEFKQMMYRRNDGYVEVEEKSREYDFGVVVLNCKWIIKD